MQDSTRSRQCLAYFLRVRQIKQQTIFFEPRLIKQHAEKLPSTSLYHSRKDVNIVKTTATVLQAKKQWAIFFKPHLIEKHAEKVPSSGLYHGLKKSVSSKPQPRSCISPETYKETDICQGMNRLQVTKKSATTCTLIIRITTCLRANQQIAQHHRFAVKSL